MTYLWIHYQWIIWKYTNYIQWNNASLESWWILKVIQLSLLLYNFLSRGSFWSRVWTYVSCIAGRFFTVWATVVFPGGSPGEGNGNPHQDSCLKNSMDRGAWWTTGHGITELDMTYHVHVCVHTHTHTHTHIKTMTTVLKTLSSNLPVQCLYPELKKVVFNLPLNRTMLQDTFIFE